MTPDAVLVVQLAASAFMAGVIWFVQLVHYPLFGEIRGDSSADFFRAHRRWTPAVVVPPMLAEAAAAAVVAVAPPPGIGRGAALAGLGLVAILWLSTAAVQMPLHARLGRAGHDAAAIARLVGSNWLRTAAWTARAALAAWMLLAATR